MPTRPAVPMNLLQGMAAMEGYYVDDSRPNRNLNPGDIEWGDFAASHGASGIEAQVPHRFAWFATEAEGFACMKALLQTTYANLTLAQAFAKWAPAPENNVEQYTASVCQLTGLSPDMLVSDALKNC